LGSRDSSVRYERPDQPRVRGHSAGDRNEGEPAERS
jgi:hypothetical protein